MSRTGLGFRGFDLKPFLGSLASLFDGNGAIAERRLGARSRSLGAHSQAWCGETCLAVSALWRASAAAMIVSANSAAGTFAEVLGHGDKRNAVLLESALGDHIARRVPEESRLAMTSTISEG